jgi:hypothetical protein
MAPDMSTPFGYSRVRRRPMPGFSARLHLPPRLAAPRPSRLASPQLRALRLLQGRVVQGGGAAPHPARRAARHFSLYSVPCKCKCEHACRWRPLPGAARHKGPPACFPHERVVSHLRQREPMGNRHQGGGKQGHLGVGPLLFRRRRRLGLLRRAGGTRRASARGRRRRWAPICGRSASRTRARRRCRACLEATAGGAPRGGAAA